MIKIRIYLTAVWLMYLSNLYGQENSNNPHHYTGENWRLHESCNPCHIYEVSGDTGARFAIFYENDTIGLDSVFISGVSKLCISCHDGIVAGYDQKVDIDHILEGMTKYSHSHPVSIEYRVKRRSKYKLHDPDTTSSGLGGTIAEDMLVNGRVECVSCHNAHFSMEKVSCNGCPEEYRFLESSEYRSLKKSNWRSLLCLPVIIFKRKP